MMGDLKLKTRLGTLYSADIQGISFEILNNLDYLTNLLIRAAEEASVTILDTSYHQFSPQGITIAFLLAESHLTIHTWPETGMACIDFFTCGLAENAKRGISYILEELVPLNYQLKELIREA
jgi:S-adenosylmethionine decarboxylase